MALHIPSVFGVSVVTILFIMLIGVYVQKNYPASPFNAVASKIPVV